jgi:transcription-repair coupling factor (superfamily II helicase)
MRDELIDRFGQIPSQVDDLFITVRCRKFGVQLGFERLLLKNGALRCYFINKPDSPYFESDTFRSILAFIQTQTNKARLKQVGKLFLLTVDGTNTMEDIYNLLKRMSDYVHESATEKAYLQ